MKKDLVFIASGGRTGTNFFGETLQSIIDNCWSEHEPDVLADTLVNGVVRRALMDSWVEGKFTSKPWGDWSRDPAKWDNAIRQAARAIEATSASEEE